ncbi:coiled-coil domain-containing protein 192 isoform X2 [Lissotriton helveticus]
MGVGASSSSARVVKLNPDFQPFTQARVVSAGGRVVRASRCASESCSLDESGKIKALGSCKEDINVSEIAKFKDLERLYENTEEHARTLEMVLVSTEGSNLELSQKVSQLEEQLEVARNKAVSWRSYENTIFIKNQQVRSKRKLKKLQMDLAQAKQDGALTIMELKEKIKAMYKAVQAPREESTPKTPSGDSEHITPDSARHILIVELSSQLSVQQEKIQQLESILQSRDAKIKHLEVECLSRRSVTPITPKEFKNLVNADNTSEDQHSLADHSQEHNYIPECAHAQDYQHIMNAEAPNEFKQSADVYTPSTLEHSVDPVTPTTFEHLENADIIKKYEKGIETGTSQDSKLIVDDYCKSPSKIDVDFKQDVDSEFYQKSEYNEDADSAQSLEEAALVQECIEQQSNKDFEDNNRDDSNAELEKLLNQISNENSSHEGTKDTPSPDPSLLSNSAGSKTMPTPPRLSEKASPSPSESHEDTHDSVNEVFLFGSDHIENEEYVKLDDEDLF